MAGTTRSTRSTPDPFGPDNSVITESQVNGRTVVTIQFALGANLGPTSSEAKRIANGESPRGTHTVAKLPPNWSASDGTRVSFTAYAPDVAKVRKPSEPTAAELLAALPDDLKALVAKALSGK